MAKKLNNPHELLVKATLAKPKAIQEFAKAYFPVQLLKNLDPKSLKLTNKSYVTEDLKEFHNDLVFSFSIQQQPGYAYVVLEHQSTPDKLMPLRFIKYTVSLIEDLLKDDTLTQIPIITTICLYHSPQAEPYPYTNNIYELFADPSLAKGLKTFETFNLVDLSAIDNKILESHKHIGLMEKLLKYSRARDAINIFSEVLDKNKSLIVKGSYWKTILIYAIKVIGNQGNNEKK